MSDRPVPEGLRGELHADEPMSRHVSWRAGGKARAFYQPADVLDLCEFLRTRPADEAVLFVGLGSNLLVRDGGFEGSVVFTHHTLIGIEVESEVATPHGMLAFRAGSGVPAPHLARFVAKHGGAGAEWMAGVPGTVGGALAMNAGCYGGETWNHVIAVETVDRNGRLRHRTPGDFDIAYRHVASRGGADEWFVSGVFGFQPGEER
ncbi:MAG TPA: FAD-binding protein, partial [Usitatibacter sp.]|nr:FAD-binding protein [Usitatibacter sp.]